MKKYQQLISTSLIIVGANLILAFSVACFIRPHGIIMGGATGLSLTLEHYLGLNLSVALTCLNIALFFLGFFFLGKKFALTTILSTFLYPLFISIFLSFKALSALTDDILLSTILGGILLGVGMGLILRMGASTGGMDIPPLILNKKFHIPVALSLYTFDTCILLTQTGFSSTEQILYGILFTILTSFIVNKVILSGTQRSQLFIISKEYSKIRDTLLYDLNLGVSLISMETAMTQTPQMAVLCVTTSRKVYSVNAIVQKIDPYAFITISSINEVKGRGFSLDREHVH
ncbi:YitT family protein [Aminipila luticellarii]|uniref:YitT family protein n=1 Tax=Aminipila luticellarii TaxID=2507160 RepID=A0A410PXA8_9FIRM|nr:YitT family protein [Aminipila luticellarii]QAT43510.1 YitT family protein [Aminipila luticellarii]